jgi:hypothetical protein
MARGAIGDSIRFDAMVRNSRMDGTDRTRTTTVMDTQSQQRGNAGGNCTHWSGTTMFVAVSRSKIPRLSRGRKNVSTPVQTENEIKFPPEHVRRGPVPALQHLRRQVALVALALESGWPLARSRSRRGLARARPESRHAKVADLEPTGASDEDVRRLEVEVQDARGMDEAQALWCGDAQSTT